MFQKPRQERTIFCIKLNKKESETMLNKVNTLSCALMLAIFIMTGCVTSPEIQPQPDIEPEPVVTVPFDMRPYHDDMMEEMRLSYERAEEIIVGVYSGSHQDDRLGLIHYFEDFSSFDKETISWGPVMNVIVQVQAMEFKPEIISRTEFPELSDLDKVGICWDVYQRARNIFLVEGEKMLIFLQTGYDEMNNRSYRNLIDAYPVTSVCQAKDVFDLMIRNLF